MTPEQFVYWLQGFFELSEDGTVNDRQAAIIRDHLNLVFLKKTPNRPATLNLPPSGDEGWHTLLPEIQKRGGPWNDPPTQLYCQQWADCLTPSHMPSC